jgi:hypothetical protein
MRIELVGLMALLLAVTGPPRGEAGDAARLLEEPPRYGVYYDRYEPAFYTGFAPRTHDPRRMHLHLGRGNQMRVTIVLADDVVRDYPADLRDRRRAYRTLIDGGRLVLTQNRGFEDFEARLDSERVEQLAAEQATLSDDALYERNLQLLERLNRGRVFRIRIPLDEVMRRWLRQLDPGDRARMSTQRQLELINLMLPTRLFVAELDADIVSQLTALVARCPNGEPSAEELGALRPAFVELLTRVSNGIYPVRDNALQFVELTAIYPVGTLNAYTTYNGRQIPQYPTPGRRALTTHQRSKTVDHVPEVGVYSYFPWIPYMHVGPRMHNAVHTLFWKMNVKTPFLPQAWRSVSSGSRDGAPYEYLWLLSRGPMSHGCTHLNAGHISELRQMLPSDTDQLYDVDLFLNTSPRYDVFDIDGDFTPEVMGVRYFIAYSLTKNDAPDRLRARNERRAYYEWLYGGELQYDADDRGVFQGITDCRFVGRNAADGRRYERIGLHEADYESEKIQFYRLIDIPFARELRKVGVHHGLEKMATAH